MAIIPMSDPRHPMHERERRKAAAAEEEAKRNPLGFCFREHRPTGQYEDQYGNLRWADDNSRVERGVHGGR